ncbi:MAG TPA: NUDIX domain-containing protein [Pseudolysinimonas sp.]|nr:NUDIX domain-containing protein [Pseudolysinimonas sp.]
MTFRATSRVLLTDPHDRVLLFLQYGKNRDIPPRWITPGGGVDPGESHDEAAIRELREETGLIVSSLPPSFLAEDFEPDQRWHPYESGHWEWYHLQVDAFSPDPAGWTDQELTDVVEWRWFTVAELDSLDLEVEPAGLAELIRSRLTGQHKE